METDYYKQTKENKRLEQLRSNPNWVKFSLTKGDLN
jgi:hypothetical protein